MKNLLTGRTLALAAVLALGGASGMLLGCPPVNSSSIATDALFVEYTVVENNGMATATAIFRVGGFFGTPIQLAGGDAVTVNGQATTFSRVPTPIYRADLDIVDEYTFDLMRPDEGTFTSTVTAPMPVMISAPAANAELSRSETLTIMWDDTVMTEIPGRGPYRVDITGPCLDYEGQGLINDTMFTVQPNDLAEETDEGGGPDAMCEGNIAVTAVQGGTVDPALDPDGFIEVRTVTNLPFTSIP